MKHKISLEKIENIILKSKEKSILEKFTAGLIHIRFCVIT